MPDNERDTFWQWFWPLALALVMALGMYLGYQMHAQLQGSSAVTEHRLTKVDTLLELIRQKYVDSISTRKLLDLAITKLLEELDPHSAYLPARALEESQIALEGDFEGIGIQFYIVQDTIMVINVLPGGPSEMVGLQPGDKIIYVDTQQVAGVGITADEVVRLLRGPRGTKVTVKVKRKGVDSLLTFTIQRDVVEVSSVEAAFMLDDSTGYIKIANFGEKTPDEVRQTLEELLMQGMERLILDLRGNPGGYLQSAVQVADEFLPGRKLVVYTKGRSVPTTKYYTRREGLFEKGPMVVLVNEGTASAAEILSAALQEWGRAKIVGRPTFGKGLVQEQFILPDRSAVRLTVARYYTPSGRNLQRPYKGPLVESKDSATHTFFVTPAGDTLYTEGGVQPDVYVGPDTLFWTHPLVHRLMASGALVQFAYQYASAHGDQIKRRYSDPAEFARHWQEPTLISEFRSWLAQQGYQLPDEVWQEDIQPIELLVKAYIARQLWGPEGYYRVILQTDPAIHVALQQLNSSAQEQAMSTGGVGQQE